ncbi:MAG: hypothetical protein ACXWNK_05805 [Vulcanimicrobiaceae bacterium]
MYDVTDQRGVPVSRGVPKIVRVAMVVGIIIVFCVGGDVIMNASYGHVWPAAKALRIPLTGNSQ